MIDSKQKIDKNCGQGREKAKRIVGIIRRHFTFLDEKKTMLLYKSLVRSHLENAPAIWTPYKKKDKQAIETVKKNRATQLITKIKHLPYDEIASFGGLPTLVYRRMRGRDRDMKFGIVFTTLMSGLI